MSSYRSDADPSKLRERAEAAFDYCYLTTEHELLLDHAVAFARDEVRRALLGQAQTIAIQIQGLREVAQSRELYADLIFVEILRRLEDRAAALKAQSEVGATGIEPGEQP